VALAAGRHLASSWGATLYAALVAHNTSEKRSPDSTAQVMSAARVPGIAAIESALARSGTAPGAAPAVTSSSCATATAATCAWRTAAQRLL
jgi:hypothetical protein